MAGYLPTTGSLSMSQINSVFDGRGNNLGNYRGTTYQIGSGGATQTFPTGAISYSNFRGAGPVQASGTVLNITNLNTITNLSPFSDNGTVGASSADVQLTFIGSTGVFNVLAVNDGTLIANTSYISSGTTTNVWYRLTRTATSSLGTGGFISPSTTGWTQINTTLGIISAQKYNTTAGNRSGTYTLELSVNNGTSVAWTGSNIVFTATTTL